MHQVVQATQLDEAIDTYVSELRTSNPAAVAAAKALVRDVAAAGAADIFAITGAALARRRMAADAKPPSAPSSRSGRRRTAESRDALDEQLRIGVVGGTGNEGRGLAVRFALTGLRVTIGSRDAARAVEVARELSERHAAATIAGASNQDTIADSNVVILAIPFVHAGAMVDACRDVFAAGTP